MDMICGSIQYKYKYEYIMCIRMAEQRDIHSFLDVVQCIHPLHSFLQLFPRPVGKQNRSRCQKQEKGRKYLKRCKSREKSWSCFRVPRPLPVTNDLCARRRFFFSISYRVLLCKLIIYISGAGR